MREIRTYGSEGGVPQGIPTPIMLKRPWFFWKDWVLKQIGGLNKRRRGRGCPKSRE